MTDPDDDYNDAVAARESESWGKARRAADAAFEARLKADPWWVEQKAEPKEKS